MATGLLPFRNALSVFWAKNSGVQAERPACQGDRLGVANLDCQPGPSRKPLMGSNAKSLLRTGKMMSFCRVKN
jgi:hypothetical protein